MPELEKLRIQNMDTGEPPVLVQFNPAEFAVEDANTWQEQERQRRRPTLQFTAQSLKKISLELFFDTYEAGTDVRQRTSALARLLVASIDTSNGKRPPVCQLEWGSARDDSGVFPFIGVMESLKQQFVLFLPSGVPVRARLSVTFKQYISPEEEEQQHPKNNSFPARTYTVEAGDTLSGIAGRLWQRPEDWRRIAELNGIDNPMALDPGRVLAVPYVE